MFLRITGSVIRGCTDIEKCSILNEVITWKTSGYDQVSALSDWLLTNRLSADIVQEEKPRKKNGESAFNETLFDYILCMRS